MKRNQLLRLHPARLALHALAGLILFAGSACSRFDFDEKVTIDEQAFQTLPPRSLAVLPFSNASGVANANEVARERLYSELSRLGYADVELSKVDSTLSRLAVENRLEPDEVPPPLIRQAGLADAVLSGQVQRVSKRWVLIYSHIRVEVLLKLVDTRTNKTIYRNQASGTNFDFTAPTSIIGIFTGAWKTLFHLRDAEIQETFEEFSERAAGKFPQPSFTSSQGGLYLREPMLTLPRNPLYAGDVLTVEFQGTPGQRAAMSVGDLDRNLPVKEVSPGLYRIKYEIKPGMAADYCVVELTLGQKPGQQVEVSLYQQPFAVAGLPSSQPANIAIEGGPRIVPRP